MKGLGIVLLVTGLLMLAYGALADRRDSAVGWASATQAVAARTDGVPVVSAVGLAVLIGGAALVITGNRRPWRY